MLNAANARTIVSLDYLGVDIVLDKDFGPMILEFNARPGLAIQLANDRGLSPRLETIQGINAIPDDPENRVALTRELFSDQVIERTESS